MWFWRYVYAFNGPVAQLVRAPPCHGGGREFESLLGRLLHQYDAATNNLIIWGLSSAGRASALQAEGHRFEPYRPHIFFYITCRSGGTGRRPGLKIPWVVIPVPVRFRSAALMKSGRNVEFTAFLLFFCFKMFEHLWTLHDEIPRFWKASLSFFLLLTFRK